MNTGEITSTLTTLFRELVDGPPGDEAYVLNRGDRGLLGALDALSADEASASRPGGATIAAHTAHVTYGLSLMNRWSRGENPWADADWSAAWRTSAVSEGEWRALREGLRDEAHRWLAALGVAREVQPVEIAGLLGSIAHVAYHLGAIRQIDLAARGPKETG